MNTLSRSALPFLGYVFVVGTRNRPLFGPQKTDLRVDISALTSVVPRETSPAYHKGGSGREETVPRETETVRRTRFHRQN